MTIKRSSYEHLGYNIYPIDMVLGEDPKDYSHYGTTCCGKLSTLATSVILGIIELIYVTVTICGLIFALSTGTENYRESQPIFADAMPYQSIPSLLGMNFLWLIFLFLLFWGIKTVQPLLVLPLMVIQAVAALAALILFITNLWAVITGKDDLDDNDTGLSIGIVLMMFFLLVLQILCIYVIYRCYKFLREEHRKIMNSGPLEIAPLHNKWGHRHSKVPSPTAEDD